MSTSRVSPARGASDIRSLVSSSRIRSADTIDSDSADAVIAARTSGATVNPSCDVNRAARSIRSGSSANDSSGVEGVRSTRAARSASPPCSSTNSSDGNRTAIALTVKSRRTRSSPSVDPKVTDGLRDVRS